MALEPFLMTLTAVLIGNGLTLAYIWVFRRIGRQERERGTTSGLPLWVYLTAAVIPLIPGLSLFYLLH